MPSNDKDVKVPVDANVSSIQITINFGKSNIVPNSDSEDKGQKGVVVRQTFLEGGVKTVRVSYVPDDITQQSSTHTFLPPAIPNPPEQTKWRELLKDPPGLDIDTGVIVFRMNENGGSIAWLPGTTNQNPIFRPLEEGQPGVPNAVSWADYIACFIANGADAAAAAKCLDKL